MTPDFTPLSELGEFGLIDRLQDTLGAPLDETVVQGLGDDAAVYRVAEDRVHLLTTDALIEGIHFDRTYMPMAYLGFKAMAVNVSDIVAMNAVPRYATLALGVPHNVSVEMMTALYSGIQQACAAYGLTLVGGDTTGARALMLTVTVVGEAEQGRVVYRSGARPGDLLCVTGHLGAAYAGLKMLLWEKEQAEQAGEGYQPDFSPFSEVLERQLRPRARTDVVAHWAQAGIQPRALIDISDGLASEVNHLCRRSGCGARVRAAALPIALQTRAVAERHGEDVDTYALFGGEDYELLFALPETDLPKLETAGADFVVIGTCTAPEDGVEVETPEGEVLPLMPQGYTHF